MEVTPILFNLLKASYESLASLFAPGLQRSVRWNRWRWHPSPYATVPNRARCPFCLFPPSPGEFHLDSRAGPPSVIPRHACVLSLAPRRQGKSSLQHRGTPPCRYLYLPPRHSRVVPRSAVIPTSSGAPPSALKFLTPFG